MDALTAAGAFGSIVQLICNFRSEKGASAALDHQQFIEWLEHHRHEEIKNLICNTAALRTEIDILLRADHAIIMSKLDAINTTLAAFASRVSEFRGLTMTMVPGAELSQQAISILNQFVSSQSRSFFRIRAMGGYEQFCLERGGSIQYGEPRFVEDDLTKLVELGLLSLSYSNRGEPVYGITRNAVRFMEAIGGQAPSQ